MVTTNDYDLAQRIRHLRSHGAETKYTHTHVGGNFRLDAMQAAVLRVKLPYLDTWTTARQDNAQTYRQLFTSQGIEEVSLPEEAPQRCHVYNQFAIQTPRRDILLETLTRQEIGAAVYYPTPLHLQPCFTTLGYCRGAFPRSEYAAARSLGLPIYPELTREMQQEVVRAIATFHRD